MEDLETNWIDPDESQTDEAGIKDVTIINVTGLPNKYGGADKNCHTVMKMKIASARSVAIIAEELANDFPEIFKKYHRFPHKHSDQIVRQEQQRWITLTTVSRVALRNTKGYRLNESDSKGRRLQRLPLATASR